MLFVGWCLVDVWSCVVAVVLEWSCMVVVSVYVGLLYCVVIVCGCCGGVCGSLV